MLAKSGGTTKICIHRLYVKNVYKKVTKKNMIMKVKKPNYIADAEIAQMEAEKKQCQVILENFTVVKVILWNNNGEQYNIDNFPNFPFSIKREVKVLLNDAINQYNDIINQIKNQKNEQK